MWKILLQRISRKLCGVLSENEITLKIEEIENEPDMVKPVVLLNKKYNDFKIIGDSIVYRKGVIYCFEMLDDDFQMLKETFAPIKKDELEPFLTLAHQSFKSIVFDYKGYSVIDRDTITGIPQITIEKIAKDKSLYLKAAMCYSAITDSFIKENDIDEIVVINNIEKKILICRPEGSIDIPCKRNFKNTWKIPEKT